LTEILSDAKINVLSHTNIVIMTCMIKLASRPTLLTVISAIDSTQQNHNAELKVTTIISTFRKWHVSPRGRPDVWVNVSSGTN